MVISEKEWNEDGSPKEFVMDYSKINSWEDFSENFDQIKKDHLKNIREDKNRINCINVLLKSEPQGDYFRRDRDEEHIIDKMNQYYFKYQQIMKSYLINNMVMLDDIVETEHFSSLSQSERDLFIEFHKHLGNEVIKKLFRNCEVEFYEDGRLKSVRNKNKDGQQDGLQTSWYSNGQKEIEGTFKDGKWDGLWTSWYENGQKKGEGIFKDGKLISNNLWNEDGSVKRVEEY